VRFTLDPAGFAAGTPVKVLTTTSPLPSGLHVTLPMAYSLDVGGTAITITKNQS
jgi:hypothetical protein